MSGSRFSVRGLAPHRGPTRATAVTACAFAGSLLVLAGCASGSTPAGSGGTGPAAAEAPASQRPTTGPTTTPAPASRPLSAVSFGAALHPPAVAGLTWHAAGTSVGGAPATYLATTDNGAIGLMWMDPTRVTFRFVPGYRVPEGGPSLARDNRPSTWVPRLVAAFNGGFMLKDGPGGYAYAGRQVRSMRTGLATMLVDAYGRLTVGRWGRDLTSTAGAQVVRQNLRPLVDDYRSMTSPTDSASTWGVANAGLSTANRSALGELADHSLVFAYGHELRPDQMAAAMVLVHARVAMVLDMNKSWPGGFVYRHRGRHVDGTAVQPQEYHSPSVYLARYTKDFVAVLAR